MLNKDIYIITMIDVCHVLLEISRTVSVTWNSSVGVCDIAYSCQTAVFVSDLE